jgi:hypothetical protein
MNIAELEEFPVEVLGMSNIGAWNALCHGLAMYEPPERTLRVSNKARKWEIVSAYQKSVRRGDKVLALRLVSAMSSMPEEWAYFHRRVATTLCEDVGPADVLFVLWAIAALTVFTPKRTGSANYRLISFITEKACDLEHRSHAYCSFAVIESALQKLSMHRIDDLVQSQLMHWALHIDTVGLHGTQRQKWLYENNWRGEGMLKYLALELPIEMTLKTGGDWPPVTLMYGLPNYCYDQHTRVGLNAIARLARKLKLTYAEPRKIVGEAVFYLEGVKIKNELHLPELTGMEQEMIPKWISISYDAWMELRQRVWTALTDGTMDQLRLAALKETYG